MSNDYERFDGYSPPSFFKSIRFLLSLIIFLGIMIQYAHKSDISVAIVCMVNHTAIDGVNNGSEVEHTHSKLLGSSTCLFTNTTDSSDPDGEFVWSKAIQEFVLSSYFYGYLISQIPGGYLAYTIGPKKVFLVSMFVGSIGTILVPVSARWHYMALIICRFLTGVAQGVMWPTMMGMWSKWAPKNEKSFLIGIGNSGSQIGSIVGFSLGGYLCRHGGWPMIFYSFGIGGLVWCVLWFLLTADSPEKHKLIKDVEKSYIINHTISQNELSNKQDKTPWLAIITCKSCISLFVAHFCQAWGVILFLTNAPTYMKEVLKFDIKSNGALLAIPYMTCLIVIIFSGFLSDRLIKNYHVSPCKVRKIFNACGFIIPAGLTIWMSYASCENPYLGVVLLSLGIGISGCCNGGGFVISYNEVAGQYSGITFGISNTIASCGGIIVPYLISAITINKTQEEWRIVFFITAGVYLVGAFASIIFGSAKLEPWANKDCKKDEPEESEQIVT